MEGNVSNPNRLTAQESGTGQTGIGQSISTGFTRLADKLIGSVYMSVEEAGAQAINHERERLGLTPLVPDNSGQQTYEEKRSCIFCQLSPLMIVAVVLLLVFAYKR